MILPNESVVNCACGQVDGCKIGRIFVVQWLATNDGSDGGLGRSVKACNSTAFAISCPVQGPAEREVAGLHSMQRLQGWVRQAAQQLPLPSAGSKAAAAKEEDEEEFIYGRVAVHSDDEEPGKEEADPVVCQGSPPPAQNKCTLCPPCLVMQQEHAGAASAFSELASCVLCMFPCLDISVA